MKTVQKIVANPTTDGIILILSDGNVIAHMFYIWADTKDVTPIKQHFAGEVGGWECLSDYNQSPYHSYSNEVEHPDAVTVYTKEEGWLI